MVDPNPEALPLGPISRATVEHYQHAADAFRESTRDHDVRQNIDTLLRHIEGTPPFRLLDFGCGPGRDLATLTALGHTAIGLDAAPAFVKMARETTGCAVWHQDFLALTLPAAHFDGVFANASLFHVPVAELPRVLRQLHGTLKPGGVLLSSNPRGDDREGWYGDRYGVFHRLESWQAFMSKAGFLELEHYYRPAGLPREQQPWLASAWRAEPG